MKNSKKYLLVIVLMCAISGAFAQVPDSVEKYVAWGLPEWVDYRDGAKLFGTRNDHSVLIIYDSASNTTKRYWAGRQVDGFYIVAKGGWSWDIDFKNPETNVNGYDVQAGIGWIGHRCDFSVTMGNSQVGNSFQAGDKYPAWYGLFTARVVPVLFNKKEEVWRIDLGACIGYQDRKVISGKPFETEYIVFDESYYSGTTAGLTFGGEIRLEWRQLMGGLRIFAEAGYRTYTTTFSSYVEVDGVVLDDTYMKCWRHNFRIGLGIEYQFGKSANNYRSVQ
ncbi:MAG: hypothetical protein J6T72_02000 [Alphaproteobacteria bacterium]|nr:hypothetical protein [Alphaproteobacteria bacterium]